MRKGFKNYLYVLFSFFFCSLLFTSNHYIVEAKSIKEIPMVEYAAFENMPFIEGISNALYVSSKNYSDDIQYQVLYKSSNIPKDTFKIVNNVNTINGWTNPTKPNALYRVELSNLKLSAGTYKLYVRIKRTARTGDIKSIYGSYDSEYYLPFVVVKDPHICEKIGAEIDKTYYTKGDNINFGSLDKSSPSMLYKLHLYNLKNKSWLINLTEYETTINYSLSNIPIGTYLVDIWYKSPLSENNYDGLKLWIIEVIDENSSKDFNESTFILIESTRKQSSVQERLYEYLTNKTNRESVKERAFRLNGNSESNACVYFVSEALRRVEVGLGDNVCTTGQLNNNGSKNKALTNELLKMGWKFSKDISELMPGDICLTTPFGGGEGKPSHSYIFMGWVESDNMKYAYICDNQVSEYGSVYHIRNIKNSTQDKEAFYYFMYKPVKVDK